MTKMNVIMLKKILKYPVRPQYCGTVLRTAGIFFQTERMNYSWLAFRYCVHENYKFHSMSSIFKYIFHNFAFKFSHTVSKYEVQSLCSLILSNDSENWDKEKVEELKKALSFLLSIGYSSKEIIMEILPHMKSNDCFYAKLKILSSIDSDIILLLPLLSLPITLLQIAARNAKTDRSTTVEFSNRIQYLSHHLELEPSQLILVLTKHTSLLTMKFNRLHTKMNILKNANISPKYIVKDLWIFNYNEQLLANRIHAAVESGIELKPWMLRCSENVFQSVLIKYSEAQRILKGETLEAYLAKKLNCSIEYVNYMMERNKLLRSINIPKLEQVINFLLEKGYKAEEIRLFPKVFCSSIQTLKKRVEELQHVRGSLPSIGQLYSSKKRLHLMESKEEIKL